MLILEYLTLVNASALSQKDKFSSREENPLRNNVVPGRSTSYHINTEKSTYISILTTKHSYP